MSSLKRKQKRRKGLVFNKAGDILIFKVNRIETNVNSPGEIVVFGLTDEIYKASDYVPQVLINNIVSEFIESKSEYQDPDS